MLYDVKKSEEDLRSKSHQHASDKSPANTSFKEKTDYLREKNKNKTELIKILSRQINIDTVFTEIKEQTTETNQIYRTQIR